MTCTRDRFGEALVAGLREQRGTDLPDSVVDKMRGKAYAAPCAVVLIASPHLESNVPEWEQVASATSIGGNRLIRLAQDMTTNKVRLRITKSPVCIALSDFGLFREPKTK